MRRTILAVCIMGVVFCPGSRAMGGSRDVPNSTVTLFFAYNNWKEAITGGDTSLYESSIGLSISQRIQPGATIDIWSAYTSAGYSVSGGNDTSLSSLNDTRVKGTYYFPDQPFGIAVLANLPTGKRSLTDEQYIVAAGVADNSRKYLVRRFGQGLDLGGELFFSPELENARVLIGAGFLYKGSYQIRASDAAKYKFGDEIYGRAEAGVTIDRVDLSASGTFKTYTKDEYDDQAVYQSGNAIIASARIGYKGAVNASLAAGTVMRGKARIPNGGVELTEESLNSSRDELFVEARASIPAGERLRLLGQGELRRISENGYAISSPAFRPKSDYTGVGAGVNYQITLPVSAGVVATYYTGTVDDSHDLTGLGVTAALVIRYW